ncbi:MAG: class I SAM-dependent methyltransferase [Thermodesulfovibrionales bacterium]|nr:class I SAM-dependent methyltransferase [Thermodesulfovibrionales bacterium]
METKDEKTISPLATPGIHGAFFKFVSAAAGARTPGPKVLEIGAGRGAFTKRLHEAGFDISACDISGEGFLYDKVPFTEANISQGLPYEDSSYGMVVAVEVMEHLFDHERIFSECARVLKEGGLFLISTPNILSLKSRMRFLLSGFHYSFKPLDLTSFDGMQHVSALSFDQYQYLARKYGFHARSISADKHQSTSRALSFLRPLLSLFSLMRGFDNTLHNNSTMLLGRTIFIAFEKDGK